MKKIVEAKRSKEKKAKRKKLDHFHHRLTMDGDTRTEDAMQDLRSLRDAFRKLNVIAPNLNQAMIDEEQNVKFPSSNFQRIQKNDLNTSFLHKLS